MSPVLVLSTAPTALLAKKIAHALVRKKLAACVQISAPVKSIYRWKGRVSEAQEVQLWIKTRAALFKRVAKEISALHPYEVPEIISIPIQQGLEDYLSWLREQTTRT